jgi:hypothetical protein
VGWSRSWYDDMNWAVLALLGALLARARRPYATLFQHPHHYGVLQPPFDDMVYFKHHAIPTLGRVSRMRKGPRAEAHGALPAARLNATSPGGGTSYLEEAKVSLLPFV